MKVVHTLTCSSCGDAAVQCELGAFMEGPVACASCGFPGAVVTDDAGEFEWRAAENHEPRLENE